jgi:hypothetical protein
MEQLTKKRWNCSDKLKFKNEKLIFSILISFFLLSIVCSAQILKIDEFSLEANGEGEIISLKKNGELTVENQKIGVLSGDGYLKDLEGKTLAAIDEQGKVVDGDKKAIGLIDKRGNINFGSGKVIGWTAGSKFNVSEKEFLTLSPDKKNLYKTASFLIFLKSFSKKTTKTEIEIKLNEK